MGKAAKNGFNPKVFLAKVGTGKKISKYRKDQTIFAQGDVADTIFYIQKGKVKIAVVSARGKEAVVAIMEHECFFGEGCLNGQIDAHRDSHGDGRMPDHLDNENGHDGSPAK